eukprot:scaffold137573_cov184-Phaeocystis_antarctica.AAC.1
MTTRAVPIEAVRRYAPRLWRGVGRVQPMLEERHQPLESIPRAVLAQVGGRAAMRPGSRVYGRSPAAVGGRRLLEGGAWRGAHLRRPEVRTRQPLRQLRFGRAASIRAAREGERRVEQALPRTGGRRLQLPLVACWERIEQPWQR